MKMLSLRIPSVIIFFLSCFYFHSSSFAIPSVSELSLEEKIGQLLMVHFHGEEANEEARRLIQDVHVGGIIYYNWANGLHSPRQVAELSAGLQQITKGTPHGLPLLIAVDQEGGAVNRLKNGFTLFPSSYGLGLTEEYRWGKESALIVGQELKAVGVSLNLAPVADIYTNPANPVIGIRAFSSDPLKVACWAGQALAGYREAGIVAALKHFPGHGDAAVDSHAALPVIAKTREELDRCELLPFHKLAGQADAMLTAHLMFPALDPDHCVTFSKKIVTNLLRKEINFQGVAITDSLAMAGALVQSASPEEAAIMSLEAGHDLILLGGKQLLETQKGLEFSVEDVKSIHQSILKAVKSGRLAEKQIDESVGRILMLKQKAGLFEPVARHTQSLTNVGTAAHRTLALQIARRALRFGKRASCLPLSLQQEPTLVVAPDFLKDELNQTSWIKLSKIIYYKELNPDQDTIQAILEEANRARACIFFAYQTAKAPAQQQLFLALRTKVPSLVALVLRDPNDATHLSSADVLLYTFGPTSCSLQAGFDSMIESVHE